jgi:hypothetical protein
MNRLTFKVIVPKKLLSGTECIVCTPTTTPIAGCSCPSKWQRPAYTSIYRDIWPFCDSPSQCVHCSWASTVGSSRVRSQSWAISLSTVTRSVSHRHKAINYDFYHAFVCTEAFRWTAPESQYSWILMQMDWMSHHCDARLDLMCQNEPEIHWRNQRPNFKCELCNNCKKYRSISRLKSWINCPYLLIFIFQPILPGLT